MLDILELFKDDERIYINGEYIVGQIQELALKYDERVIKAILKDEQLKKNFFSEVDGTLIFKREEFIQFIGSKEYLSDSYTRFKNTIGLTIDGNTIKENRDVVLTWTYKDCVLEGGQDREDSNRDEVFYNEILASEDIDRLFDPKVMANFKRYDMNGEQLRPELIEYDNLIIKGNNLIALHSLKSRFEEEVKLIYIDPPYNTGGDANIFTYNNTFNHSTWLTFMKNRLEIAKKLLRKDGFIAISIDHYELFYLGVLADEIFGRENRIGVITVVHKPEGRNQEKFISSSNEFMLIYAKNKELASFNKVILDRNKLEEYKYKDEFDYYKLNNYLRSGGGDHNLRKNKPHFYYPIYVNPDNLEVSDTKKPGFEPIYPITNSGQERTWKTIKDTFIEKLKADRIIALRDEKGSIQVFEKYYKSETGQLIKSHWIDKRYNAIHHGTKLLENIIGRRDFSYPKSLYLIMDTLKIMTSDDDIILDFFAGSGTTGHATLALNKEDGGNRRFILIEQISEHIKICCERNHKVIQQEGIDDSFIYCELMKWNEIFIEKIDKANTKEEIEGIWEEMKEKSFLSYRVSIDEIDKNIEDFKELGIKQQKEFLFSILDKNHLYVSLSEIEDEVYSISEIDKELNKEFYKL